LSAPAKDPYQVVVIVLMKTFNPRDEYFGNARLRAAVIPSLRSLLSVRINCEEPLLGPRYSLQVLAPPHSRHSEPANLIKSAH
jgi:hypothetical protein